MNFSTDFKSRVIHRLYFVLLSTWIMALYITKKIALS
jgi:uncharacterized membrane protein